MRSLLKKSPILGGTALLVAALLSPLTAAAVTPTIN